MIRYLLVAGLLMLGQPGMAVAGQRTTTTPIEHFVVMMQSNHSFDSYFGTYPGADGIPADVCMPHSTDNLSADRCVKPFRLGDQSPSDLDHRPATQRAQYNGGKMNGFVEAFRKNGRDGTNAMGYYDGADLPYYWNIADRFTLFDKFFSSALTGSRLNHFYWVAGVPTPRAASRCRQAVTATSRRSSIGCRRRDCRGSSTSSTTTRRVPGRRPRCRC